MKLFVSIFTVLILMKALSHASYKEHVYSIKLGTYKYLQNAVTFQERVPYDTFILKNNNFYGVYTGYFKDKDISKKVLKKVRKKYRDSYIDIVSIQTKTFTDSNSLAKVKKDTVVKQKDYLTLGRDYYKVGDYESAFAAFDHLLIDEPSNQLARLEYARTLYQLGFFKASKKEFNTVLASNPPKIVQKNIHAYLSKIDNFSKEHIFYGSVGVGLSYDDNLGYNTDKKSTTYGALTFQNDTNKTKGFYESLSFGLNHLYTTDKFSWSNTLYSYNEFQNEDIDNINFLNFTTTLLKSYDSFRVSLPFSISYIWLDKKAYSLSYASTPTLDYSYNKTTNYGVSLKYQDTKIKEDKNRDYKTYGAKFFLSKQYNKVSIYLNAAVEKDERETEVRYDVSKDRTFLSSSISYDILEGTTFGVGYSYNMDFFTELDDVLGYKREDRKSLFSNSFKQKFSKSSFALLSYRYMHNDSNINSYCYDKNSYTLSYWYAF